MKPLSRRAILRGLGGAAMPLPFLEAMRPAFGQPKTGPKRVIFMYTSCGTVKKHWKPAAVGSNPPASRILQPLATPELKPYLTVLSGVNAEAGSNATGHGPMMATALTASQAVGDFDAARAKGVSIDFALGKRVKSANPSIPFDVLQFGVLSRGYQGSSFFSYRERVGGGVEGVYAEDSPATMYSRVFSNSVAGGGDPALAKLNQILLQDKSALDFTVDQYKRLGMRLGAVDRTRMEEHAELLRSIEKRLVTSTCNKPTLMNPAATGFRAVGDMQMDMLAAAMACDQTRVATLQWSTAQSRFDWKTVDPTWVVIPGRTMEGVVYKGEPTSYWHALSHIPISWDPASPDKTDRDTLEMITREQIWLAQRVAYLAQKLKGYTDANGKSVLDNTLILWTSECAEGSHSFKDIPFTVVGNMGGAFKSNIHLAYGGRQHGDIFATIGTAMGFSGFERFGREGFSKGVLDTWLA
jgi:hypothetical protein